MRTVLMHPVFGRLLLSHIVALVGTGMATIALGFLAFSIAGGQAGTVIGTVLAIKMLSFMLIAPVASTLFARIPVRTVLIGSDVLRALVAVALPFVVDVWHIYGLIIVLHMASAVFTPAFQATIPRVLRDEGEYTRALSLSRLVYDLEALVSPALAGLLLFLIPANSLFFGTAVGFAASALLISSIALPKNAPPAHAEDPFRKRLSRGSRLLLSTPALRGVFALQLAVAGSGSYAFVQTVTIVQAPLGQQEGVVAIALGALGLGSICSALASPRLLERFGTRRVMLTGGVLISVPPFAIPLVLLAGGSSGVWLLCGLWFIIGLGFSGVLTPVGRVIRSMVAEEDLTAVFAAQFSLAHGWWLICYPIAGWVGAYVSLETAAILLALISTGATIAASRLWTRPPAAVIRQNMDMSMESAS